VTLAIFVIFTSALLLRLFYELQRKLFIKSYYSFAELVIGLPDSLSLSQVFTLRFLPPFVVGFIAIKIVGSSSPHFLYFSLIGVIAALINIIPAIINIQFSKLQRDDSILFYNNKPKIYFVYFIYLVSFALISALGAYVATTISSDQLKNLLPSQKGLVDGLWAAIIISLLSFLNKPHEY